MLYEMIAVVGTIVFSRLQRPFTFEFLLKLLQVRPGNIAEVKEIAHKAGILLLQNGGVIRSLTNWGPFLLTKPVKKHQQKHDSGHHFVLRFDASPNVQEKVRKAVAIDPRMIRCGVVKMVGGEKLVGEHGIQGMSEIGADGPVWRKDERKTGGIFGGLSTSR
ncbi:MAG: hypothetical protein Q9166_000601 [cf. Caloplaca sp. 2 TL-2023]